MTEIATPADVDVVRQAKIDLAACFRAAAMHGFNEGIDNHFSLAVPGRDDLFLLNRYGPHWSELCASDILTVDLDGNIVEGTGEWDVTAFLIHRGAHRARADARCVLHTHMPYATAVSMTEGGFESAVSQNSMYFHGHTARLEYGGLATAEEEGTRIGEAIGDETTVVMLENHGVLVIGRDVADAWHKVYFLERACQMQVLAQSTGGALLRVPDEVAELTADQWASDTNAPPSLFAAVKRQLDRENPGYQL
jgi:ribulose-5-phosphate 4-epimerase/fuculose-1-phosphate aldolase